MRTRIQYPQNSPSDSFNVHKLKVHASGASWEEVSDFGEPTKRLERRIITDEVPWATSGTQFCAWTKLLYASTEAVKVPGHDLYAGNHYPAGQLVVPSKTLKEAYGFFPSSIATTLRFREHDLCPSNFFGLSAESVGGYYLSKPQTQSFEPIQSPLDTGFSVVYLLRDLWELPRLARTFIQFKKYYARFRSPKSGRELAAQYLGYKWGVVPTFHDIKSFAETIVKWGTYIDSLDSWKRLYTYHAPHRVIDNARYIMVSRQFRAVTSFPLDAYVNVDMEAGPVTLFMTAKYYFVSPELNGIISRLRQFVDYFGLLDPAAFWDMVPFSFLIDWVVDVSGWLTSNFKPRLIPVDMVITDWCESIGREITITGKGRVVCANDNTSGTYNHPITLTGKAMQYCRKQQFPAPLIARTKRLTINDSIITMGRVLSGGALVGVLASTESSWRVAKRSGVKDPARLRRWSSRR